MRNENAHIDAALLLTEEALDHLERGSIVGMKYHRGAVLDAPGEIPRILFTLELEALDIPLTPDPRVTGGSEKVHDIMGVERVKIVPLAGGAESLGPMTVRGRPFFYDEAGTECGTPAATVKSNVLNYETIRSALLGAVGWDSEASLERAIRAILTAQEEDAKLR